MRKRFEIYYEGVILDAITLVAILKRFYTVSCNFRIKELPIEDEEKEYCECSQYDKDLEGFRCGNCGKLIKPKPRLPEKIEVEQIELNESEVSSMPDISFRSIAKAMAKLAESMGKINEIIDYLSSVEQAREKEK